MPTVLPPLVVGFDLDMTLVDTRPGIAAVLDALAAETGVEIDRTAAVGRLGPPLDDVEDRADLVATDHAELAGHYRAAHEVGRRAQDATTEELRQAFVHYRAIFVVLLGEATGAHAEAAETRPADAAVMDSRDGVATGSRDMTSTGGRTETPAETRPADATTTSTDGELDGQRRLDLTEGERTRQAPPA